MRVGSFLSSLPLIESEIFLLLDMDKNIWEQVSSALKCRETGELLNTLAALFALIRLDEGCGPFITQLLFFSFLKNYLKVFGKHF